MPEHGAALHQRLDQSRNLTQTFKLHPQPRSNLSLQGRKPCVVSRKHPSSLWIDPPPVCHAKSERESQREREAWLTCKVSLFGVKLNKLDHCQIHKCQTNMLWWLLGFLSVQHQPKGRRSFLKNVNLRFDGPHHHGRGAIFSNVKSAQCFFSQRKWRPTTCPRPPRR